MANAVSVVHARRVSRLVSQAREPRRNRDHHPQQACPRSNREFQSTLVSKRPPLPAAEKGKNENCETKSKNIILPDKKQISL